METTSPTYTSVRGPRFKYRHTPQAAAQELGIPQSWIWYWLYKNLIRSRPALGTRWIDIAQVKHLLDENGSAVCKAFEHTGEPITCPTAANRLQREATPNLARQVCSTNAPPETRCVHVSRQELADLLNALKPLERTIQ